LRPTNAQTIFVMLAIDADLHQMESALVTGLDAVHGPALQMQPRRKTNSPTFRDSVKSAQTELGDSPQGQEMSRLSFALLIVAGLFFTAYFGAAAWRLSDDGHMDVTGQIRPTAK
jgi:hypothetical protein